MKKKQKRAPAVTFIAFDVTPDGLVGIPVATCTGCGCRDDRACRGGCAWASVDREKRTGICTNCVKPRRKKK